MGTGVLYALAAGLMWGLVFVGPLLLPEYPAALQSVGRYLAFGLIALTGATLQWACIAMGYYAVFSWATSLRLRDVAEIRIEGATRNRAYFVGPDPAVAINVSRAAQGDAIALQGLVQSVVDQIRPTLPEGVKIDLLRTRAEEISARLKLLLSNGGMGLALVVGLLFLPETFRRNIDD